LISVVNDHIAYAPRACDEDCRVEPRISLITSFKCKVEAHSECIGADFALSQLFQDFLLSCSCSVIQETSVCCLFLALFSSRRRVALLTLSCASRGQLRHVFPSCISYPDERFAGHHRGRAQSPSLHPHWLANPLVHKEKVHCVLSHSPPPPGRIEPLRRGPSNLPPLKITVDLSPWGPFPICLKDSISHSRWKRN
jgi:hypothetical protein